MALLNDTDIKTQLAALPGWQRQDNTITKTYQFKNFVEAIAFVDQLVAPAEAAGHHPDLQIFGYNKVTISLMTHDEGGLTTKDFSLAATFETL